MPSPTASFPQLVERHRGEILAYLVRLLGELHEAEDVCQEAFLRAYRAFDGRVGASGARAWLFKIATRTAFNVLRARKRRAAWRSDVEPDALPAIASALPDRRESLAEVARAVGALPPKQRAALMQRRFHGLPYDEIALTLGGSRAAARANVYQAVKKLRAALGDAEKIEKFDGGTHR